MLPRAKDERPAALDDDGQRAAGAAPGDSPQPGAQVGLAAKRPVGADRAARDVADDAVEAARDRLGVVAAPLGRDRQPFGDEPLTLGLAPAHDVGVPLRVDGGLPGMARVKLVREARRRREAGRRVVVLVVAHAIVLLGVP